MSYHLLRRIYTSSIIYALANSIEALAPFVLSVVLTRKLSTDEYGVWVLFIALFTFLRPVISLSVHDALKMHYFEMERKSLSEFILSSAFLASSITLLLACLSILGKGQLSVWLKFPEEWIVSIVLTAYLYSIFHFLLTFNQFENNKKRFILLHVIQSGISILMAITLVIYGWSWKGAIIGKSSGLLIAAGFGAIWLVRDIRFRINEKVILKFKELIKFGVHYLPTGLSLVLVPLTDRMIITHFLGLSQNGLYGVAALFGSAFFIAINGFLYAWMPWLFRRLMKYDLRNQAEIRLVSFSFLLLLPVVAFGFYFFCMLVAPFIIGSSFYNAFELIPWVLSAVVMQGYFLHNQAFLLFKKYAVIISSCSFLCVILNIVLSYLWALSYGVKGVIVATAVSYLVSAIISCFFILFAYRNVKLPELTNV